MSTISNNFKVLTAISAQCNNLGAQNAFVILPHYATQNAEMPQYVACPSVHLLVCLSVRLSETFRYDFHTGRNTSKIISRLISSRFLLWLTPTYRRSGPTETPPKLGWNRGGVMSTKPAVSLKRCKIKPKLLRRTNRKSRMRFWLVPKSMTLDDVTLAEIKKVLRSQPEKNSAPNCRPMILVSFRNIRCMRIFAGVPRGRGVKYNVLHLRSNVEQERVFISYTLWV